MVYPRDYKTMQKPMEKCMAAKNGKYGECGGIRDLAWKGIGNTWAGSKYSGRS